jgi:hypothetical protein
VLDFPFESARKFKSQINGCEVILHLNKYCRASGMPAANAP